MIDDRGDAGSRPSGLFGQIALVPGMDLAAENHPSFAFGLDRDPRGIQFRAPTQRVLDLFLDLRVVNRRADLDQISDTDDAGEVVDRSFGFCLLELPVDIPGQGYQTLLYLDGNSIGGKSDPPFEDIDHPSSDLVVGRFLIGGETYLDPLGDRFDPLDPSCCTLGR